MCGEGGGVSGWFVCRGRLYFGMCVGGVFISLRERERERDEGLCITFLVLFIYVSPCDLESVGRGLLCGCATSVALSSGDGCLHVSLIR